MRDTAVGVISEIIPWKLSWDNVEKQTTMSPVENVCEPIRSRELSAMTMTATATS